MIVLRGISVALLTFVLVAGFGGPASADRLVQEIKSELSSPIDGTTQIPFHVEIESRCIDGYVVYTVVNKGPDWPKHVYMGVNGSKTGAIFDKVRVKLQQNQGVVLKADFRGQNPYSLDFIIRPSWVKQDLLARFSHTPPPGWLEAGQARVLAEQQQSDASAAN